MEKLEDGRIQVWLEPSRHEAGSEVREINGLFEGDSSAEEHRLKGCCIKDEILRLCLGKLFRPNAVFNGCHQVQQW